jgi:DinB superfamily
MNDQSLLLLLNEVRGRTIRILDSVAVEDSVWAPRGLQNTIVWHAGHAYFLLEWLTMGALGRTPRIPKGWYQTFSWASRSAQVPIDRWPLLADVVSRLGEQRDRMRRIIGELSDKQLDRPSARNSNKTVRHEILHDLPSPACKCRFPQ